MAGGGATSGRSVHQLGLDAVSRGGVTWPGGPQGRLFQGELRGPRVAAVCRQPAGQEPM